MTLWTKAFYLQPPTEILFLNQVVTLWILNQAVYPTWPQNANKNFNILRMERPIKMKYKAFFIIFEGFEINKMTLFFGEVEDPNLKPVN